MSDTIIAVLSGSAGAALVSGIFTLVQYRMKRKDTKEDAQDARLKALQYLMLYIIQERAKEHIQEGAITLEDRRMLHKWHDLYHNGLAGNGDADLLMEQVEELRVNTQ